MQNRYPTWKYCLLLVIALIGIIYALPNFYGSMPALQMKPRQVEVMVTETQTDNIQRSLNQSHIPFQKIFIENGQILITFSDADNELKARDVLMNAFNRDYTIAANLLPAAPRWFRLFGAEPMKYGLDLSGRDPFFIGS